MKSFALFWSTWVADTSAFCPMTYHKAPTTAAPLFNTPPLNQVDEMCIENVADFCLQDALECDLEEFEALVNQLTDQRGYHAEQLTRIDDLLTKLSIRTGGSDDLMINGSSAAGGPTP